MFYLTCEDNCFQLTQEGAEEVVALQSDHEEANTKLLLHAKHAALQAMESSEA